MRKLERVYIAVLILAIALGILWPSLVGGQQHKLPVYATSLYLNDAGVAPWSRFEASDIDTSNLMPAGAPLDGEFLVGDGTNYVKESGATLRSSAGLAIGTDVQAFDAGLQSISGLTTAADRMIYTSALDTYAIAALTAAGRAFLDDVDASSQRATIGLGSSDTPTFSSLILSNNGETASFSFDGSASELTISISPDPPIIRLDDHGDAVVEGAVTAGTVVASNSLRASSHFSLEADGAVNVTAAGTTIDLNGLAVTELTPTSNLTITATPSIALETDGTFVYIYNGSATFTLTLQDKAVLASSALNLSANAVTLLENEGILLLMEGLEWFQIGGKSNQHNSIITQAVAHPSDPDIIEVSPDDLTFNADTTTTGIATITGDLRVDGGDIGPSTDVDLMQLADNALTVSGTGTITGGLSVDGESGLTLTKTGSEWNIDHETDVSPVLAFGYGGTRPLRVSHLAPANALVIASSSLQAAVPATVSTSASAAVAAIAIDQNDTDEPFLYYDGTSTATAPPDANISTMDGSGAVVGPSAASGGHGWAFTGMVRIEVNGTDHWMPYFSAAVN